MSKIILQPTGNKDARQHYVDTLIRPVELSKFKTYLARDEYNHLSQQYPSGLVPTWGVTPGVNNINVNKWNKIQTGDITFFSANRNLYSYGFVVHKLHSASLAKDLWGVDSKGQTWEYIYTLDDIREHDIPMSLFNTVVGYADNYNVQGFTVLDEAKSNAVIGYFDIYSDTAIEPVSEQNYKELVQDVKFDVLDIQGKAKSRAEQSFLRKSLFGNKVIDRCGICHNEYPIGFLVAAHIKKRSFCSTEEKLDYKNIVMPMCKFGCDELYEKGYIIIKDGQVVVNKAPITESINIYVHNIEGLSCYHWHEETQPYFEWHQRYHSLK